MHGGGYVGAGSSGPTSKGLECVYLGGSNGLGVSRLQLLQGLGEVLSQERTASSNQLPLILLTQATCQTARRSSGSCLLSPRQGPCSYSLPH